MHWSKASLLFSGLSIRPCGGALEDRLGQRQDRRQDAWWAGRSAGSSGARSAGNRRAAPWSGPPSASWWASAAGSGPGSVSGPGSASAARSGSGSAWTSAPGVGLLVGPLVGSGSAVGVPPPPPPPPPPAAGASARREGAAAARGVGHRGVVTGDVGVVERQHQVDVLLAVVVAEHRGPPAGVGGQIVVAGAEVDRGRQRRVVDVLWVALGVAVGVDAHDRPRRGDELHRPDRAVEAARRRRAARRRCR